MKSKILKDYVILKNKTEGQKGGIMLSKTKRIKPVDPQKKVRS